jgi:hypothetical protein
MYVRGVCMYVCGVYVCMCGYVCVCGVCMFVCVVCVCMCVCNDRGQREEQAVLSVGTAPPLGGADLSWLQVSRLRFSFLSNLSHISELRSLSSCLCMRSY